MRKGITVCVYVFGLWYSWFTINMRGFSETQCSVPQSLGLEASFGPRILTGQFYQVQDVYNFRNMSDTTVCVGSDKRWYKNRKIYLGEKQHWNPAFAWMGKRRKNKHKSTASSKRQNKNPHSFLEQLKAQRRRHNINPPVIDLADQQHYSVPEQKQHYFGAAPQPQTTISRPPPPPPKSNIVSLLLFSQVHGTPRLLRRRHGQSNYHSIKNTRARKVHQDTLLAEISQFVN